MQQSKMGLMAATLAGLMLASAVATADTYVRGYTRSDGTRVQGHYRSSPDSSFNNNWSTRGNTNPYTGQPGYKTPQYSAPSYRTPSYGSGYRSQDSYNSRRY